MKVDYRMQYYEVNTNPTWRTAANSNIVTSAYLSLKCTRTYGNKKAQLLLTNPSADTVKSLLLSQEDKPQSHRTVRKISREAGIHRSSVLCGLFTKVCVSSAARKGALNSWLKRTACTRYLRHAVWETITW